MKLWIVWDHSACSPGYKEVVRSTWKYHYLEGGRHVVERKTNRVIYAGYSYTEEGVAYESEAAWKMDTRNARLKKRILETIRGRYLTYEDCLAICDRLGIDVSKEMV